MDEAIRACWHLIDSLESLLHARGLETDTVDPAEIETCDPLAEPAEAAIRQPLPRIDHKMPNIGLKNRFLLADNAAERNLVSRRFPEVKEV